MRVKRYFFLRQIQKGEFNYEKKLLTTLMVVFALVFSVTGVYAEDQLIISQDNKTITETEEITLNTEKWTGEEDVVFNVDFKGCKGIGIQEFYVYGDNDEAELAYFNDRGRVVELDDEGKGTLTLKKDVLENTKTYGDSPFPNIAIDWSKINKIELMLCVRTNTGIKIKYVFIPVEVKASTPTPTPTPTPSNNNTKTDSKDTTTKQETTTKKDYPKTGDQSNVVIYSSMLALSILAMICLRKKLA